MNKIHCTKGIPMHKKPSPSPYSPRLVHVGDKAGDTLISEREQMRASSLAQRQREEYARREALAILEQDSAHRDALAFGPASTVREDLQADRQRPLDAPMATRNEPALDVRAGWDKWRFTVALALWSAACFLLGRLS